MELENWALLEAAARAGTKWRDPVAMRRAKTALSKAIRALAENIQTHEKEPIAFELLCARKACAGIAREKTARQELANEIENGNRDELAIVRSAMKAIELYKVGKSNGAS